MQRLLARASVLAAACFAASLGACVSVPACRSVPTCPSGAEVAELARRYLAQEKLPGPSPEMTMAGAACGQAKLMAALEPALGKPIGYKAGLTNAAVQKRFGIEQPLLGTLLERMVLREGAEVPARMGVRPFLEADLIVEVGSSAIHEATTPEQVLASLRAVYPFIELPDVALDDPAKITATSLRLYDVGARLGVLGKPLPVAGQAGLAEALRTMTVRTTDGGGKELAVAPGSAILGHPLNAVIWIAAELRKQGASLQPGDLLSLGAFSAGPIPAGGTVRVTYDGLPGNPSVQVTFP